MHAQEFLRLNACVINYCIDPITPCTEKCCQLLSRAVKTFEVFYINSKWQKKHSAIKNNTKSKWLFNYYILHFDFVLFVSWLNAMFLIVFHQLIKEKLIDDQSKKSNLQHLRIKYRTHGFFCIDQTHSYFHWTVGLCLCLWMCLENGVAKKRISYQQQKHHIFQHTKMV